MTLISIHHHYFQSPRLHYLTLNDLWIIWLKIFSFILRGFQELPCLLEMTEFSIWMTLGGTSACLDSTKREVAKFFNTRTGYVWKDRLVFVKTTSQITFIRIQSENSFLGCLIETNERIWVMNLVYYGIFSQEGVWVSTSKHFRANAYPS